MEAAAKDSLHAESVDGLERDAASNCNCLLLELPSSVLDHAARGAVDASRIRRRRNIQRHMVEDIEGLELELALDSSVIGMSLISERSA